MAFFTPWLPQAGPHHALPHIQGVARVGMQRDSAANVPGQSPNPWTQLPEGHSPDPGFQGIPAHHLPAKCHSLTPKSQGHPRGLSHSGGRCHHITLQQEHSDPSVTAQGAAGLIPSNSFCWGCSRNTPNPNSPAWGAAGHSHLRPPFPVDVMGHESTGTCIPNPTAPQKSAPGHCSASTG